MYSLVHLYGILEFVVVFNDCIVKHEMNIIYNSSFNKSFITDFDEYVAI